MIKKKNPGPPAPGGRRSARRDRRRNAPARASGTARCGRVLCFFCSSRRRHTRLFRVTGVQTCALPICKDLPADFAKIPADGPKANVRVSIPGTPEAHEAAIANSIPQTATVKISEAKLTVTYDGAPKFVPLPGTKGLTYAANCALPVI